MEPGHHAAGRCNNWPSNSAASKPSVHQHRVERAAYRRALRIVDQHHTVIEEPPEGYLWPPEPPPVEIETLLELLHMNSAPTPSARNPRGEPSGGRYLGGLAAEIAWRCCCGRTPTATDRSDEVAGDLLSW
ncbi:hypothetical protein ACVBEQ_23255 [Nakamurella sp. GG22]